jgi:glycerol kinase
VVINYGSGAFVLECAGAVRADVPGLLTTLLASWPRAREGSTGRRASLLSAIFAVEGTVNAAATAIEWAERRLSLRVPAEDLDAYLRGGGARRHDVHFLPAVAGLGAPHWDASARPRFAGSYRGASPRDLLRSVVESIACRCAEILGIGAGAAGADQSSRERPIMVAGGLTRCRTLLQAQADLLQRPLLLCDSPDATAVGAALLARPMQAGSLPRGIAREDRLIRPRISSDEAEARFAAWTRAVYGD